MGYFRQINIDFYPEFVGKSVSEGCWEEEKPIHKKQCERFFDCEEYAECVDGECVCTVGFMGELSLEL